MNDYFLRAAHPVVVIMEELAGLGVCKEPIVARA